MDCALAVFTMRVYAECATLKMCGGSASATTACTSETERIHATLSAAPVALRPRWQSASTTSKPSSASVSQMARSRPADGASHPQISCRQTTPGGGGAPSARRCCEGTW